MNQVVFNFHDVILLMTAMLCVCFALLIILTNPPKNTNNYFLAAFLIAHAFIPLHELILWGAEFKLRVRDFFPEIYFVGGFAYFVDGALLYFYIKSLVFRDFHVRKKDSWHLVPLVVFLLFMIFSFYRFPVEIRKTWIVDEIFVYSSNYITVDFLCKLLRVFYCAACFMLIIKYKELLKSTHSNIEKVNIAWLKLLVIGFFVTTVMEAILSSSKLFGVFSGYDFQHYDMIIFERIGLSGYYTLFALVCTLVFTSMRYFTTFETVKQKDKELPKKAQQDRLLNPALGEQIDSVMREQKLYLQPTITLDNLAEELNIPAKDLSMIINRHFNVNFYEFINGYRIEEAKQLLGDSNQKNKTITTIYLDVGFNSKSVFNTFFKKIVGTTPSEYRQQFNP